MFLNKGLAGDPALESENPVMRILMELAIL